jgi:hypothetical protein
MATYFRLRTAKDVNERGIAPQIHPNNFIFKATIVSSKSFVFVSIFLFHFFDLSLDLFRFTLNAIQGFAVCLKRLFSIPFTQTQKV